MAQLRTNFIELNSPEAISTRPSAPRDFRFRLILGVRLLFAIFVASAVSAVSAVSADFVVSIGPAFIFAELNSPEPTFTRSTAPGDCQFMRLESPSTRSTAPGDDQRKALACSRGKATDKFHRA